MANSRDVRLDTMPIENLQFFALVVDGEIAHMHAVAKDIDRIVAAYSSDPKVVPVPIELVGDINESLHNNQFWRYMDGEFIGPEDEQ